MSDHLFNTIAIVHSPFRQKFGIPRQPGLCPSVTGQIELLPPFDHPDTIRGLEDFSHIWVIFVFHAIEKDKWNPLVRPPRLGGNERVGVYASRSTHRPNPIGQSVVKLDKIENKNHKLILHISGHDLLDNTPILDIKPYLPYAENIPHASSGFLKRTGFISFQVSFTEAAKAQCQQWEKDNQQPLSDMLTEILQQDPRPACHKKTTAVREYGIQLYNLNIRYKLMDSTAKIFEILPTDET